MKPTRSSASAKPSRNSSARDATRNLLNLFFLQERAKKLAAARMRPRRSAASHARGGDRRGRHGLGHRAMAERARAARDPARRRCRARCRRHGRHRRGSTPPACRSGIFTELEARAGLDRISPAPAEVPLTQRRPRDRGRGGKDGGRRRRSSAGSTNSSREDAILATNTSALSITELAAATQHPRARRRHALLQSRPPDAARGSGRRAAKPRRRSAQRALRFVQQIGKLPVLVKDSPGFLVNRILLPYMIEAGALFWSGRRASRRSTTRCSISACRWGRCG